MANVDPFTIDLTPESIQDPQTLYYLNRFLHDLWARTGAGNDLINENIEGNVTNISLNATSDALLSRLTERVNNLEDRDLSSHFNQRIAALNQMVNEAFEDLLEELQSFHRPNRELEQSNIELQIEQIEQTRLFNTRAEEAWETGMTIDDAHDEE